MNNPFFELVKSSGLPMVQIAPLAGVSRPTLSKAAQWDGISRDLKIETLDKIAAHFGKRVVITLEPIKESADGN